MNERPERDERAGLNLGLRSRTNISRDTDTPTRAPADSASVQKEEGRAWPLIWLIVALLCVVIAVYLVIW